MRETIAELETIRTSSTPVPNWRAHAARCPTDDPGARRQWNLFQPWGINVTEAWTLAAQLGAPGAAGGRRRARQRRGLREPRALQARPDLPPFDLHEAVRLHRQRPSPERLVRPRHPCGGHDRADDRQRPGHLPGSPSTRRSCRCGCSTTRAPATRLRSSRADPLGRSLRRRRDQPLARVPCGGARRRDPDVIGALRYARRHGSLVVGAAEQPGRLHGGLPRPLHVAAGRRRDHHHGLPGGLLELGP